MKQNKNLIKGVIWEDGSVHQMNKFPATVIGKYPEQTFQEIYEINKNKSQLEKHVLIADECKKCSIFDICGKNIRYCDK